MWFVVLTCLFCQMAVHAGLEPEVAVRVVVAAAAVKNGSKFSQCNVDFRGFLQARGSRP
jgi:hypothetical protein